MSNAVWDITSKCNLNCKHCYNSEKYNKNYGSDLTYENCVKLISILKENNCKFISLLGGEPLLHPNIMEILKLCKKNDIKVAITTNGLNLSNTTIKNITESSVSHILISLDGGDSETNDNIRGHGVFDKVVSNIKTLMTYIKNYNSKIVVCIAYSLFSLNVDSLKNIVNICKNLKIEYLNLTPLINSGNASKKWKDIKLKDFELLDAIEEVIVHTISVYPSLRINIDARPLVIWYLKKRYPANISYLLGHTKCQVLDKLLYITANGNLHPCGLYTLQPGKEAQKNKYFNSNDTFNIINIKTIDDIYKSKYYIDFISSMKKLEKPEYHSNCTTCPVRNDCYPCPYQFINGVVDCDWSNFKINKMIDEIKDWTIINKADISLEYLHNEAEKLVYKSLKPGIKFCNNYLFFLKNSDKSLNFFEYLDVLNELEKKFLIKTKRSNAYENEKSLYSI